MNLRQNRYERYVLPLNYKPEEKEKLVFDLMRNIGTSQLIVVIFVGILLFSDFSKIIKKLHELIKKKNIYKSVKKK